MPKKKPNGTVPKTQSKPASKFQQEEVAPTDAAWLGYQAFLEALKVQIQTAQMRAAVSVNTQVIECITP